MDNYESWIAIYKGLRLPVFGIVFLLLAWWVFRPKNKGTFEEARYTMLDDDVDENLSEQFRSEEMDKKK